MSSKSPSRVSKSKSGFSADGGEFVLVYRLKDGSYSKKYRFDRDQVVKIARSYLTTGKGDRAIRVTKDAARYMLSQARRHQLLEADDEPADKPAVSETEVSADAPALAELPAHETTAKRKFFPPIHPFQDANVSDAALDTLAFVLSGVEPKLRQEGARLRDLVAKPEHRIPIAEYLRDDHLYVLAHLRGVDRERFDEMWHVAKTPSIGQESTEVVKLARWLRQLEIDGDGAQLRKLTDEDPLPALRDKALEILVMLYRAARRDIEESYRAREKQPTATRQWGLGLTAVLQRKAAAAAAVIDEDVLEATRTYLQQAIKLGRLIRCPAFRRLTRG